MTFDEKMVIFKQTYIPVASISDHNDSHWEELYLKKGWFLYKSKSQGRMTLVEEFVWCYIIVAISSVINIHHHFDILRQLQAW